jgi:hypothetical protein
MARARGISTGDSTMNKIELSINRFYHSAEDETGQKFQGNILAIPSSMRVDPRQIDPRAIDVGNYW